MLLAGVDVFNDCSLDGQVGEEILVDVKIVEWCGV
jgi:hypothetical protein